MILIVIKEKYIKISPTPTITKLPILVTSEETNIPSFGFYKFYKIKKVNKIF